MISIDISISIVCKSLVMSEHSHVPQMASLLLLLHIVAMHGDIIVLELRVLIFMA
jgi:hypothetical protein